MASTIPSPLLALPTELRLEIYGYIIRSVPVPTSAHLQEHQGLLLSCHQVYEEFEAEAVKATDRFLDSVQQDWTGSGHVQLRPPTLAKLPETINIPLVIPAAGLHYYNSPFLRPLLTRLITHLPSFSSMFVRHCFFRLSSDPLDWTSQAFFASIVREFVSRRAELPAAYKEVGWMYEGMRDVLMYDITWDSRVAESR